MNQINLIKKYNQWTLISDNKSSNNDKIFQRRGHKKKMLNTDGLIFFVIISIPIDKRRPHSIVKQVEHLHHCNRKLQI